MPHRTPGHPATDGTARHDTLVIMYIRYVSKYMQECVYMREV